MPHSKFLEVDGQYVKHVFKNVRTAYTYLTVIDMLAIFATPFTLTHGVRMSTKKRSPPTWPAHTATMLPGISIELLIDATARTFTHLS
jgi:hypothetical protein